MALATALLGVGVRTARAEARVDIRGQWSGVAIYGGGALGFWAFCAQSAERHAAHARRVMAA